MKLDHLVWASNALDEAVAGFTALSGMNPAAGGRHIGIGSRNALADLGNEVYLAIDGPDPEQELVDNYGARLAAMTAPALTRFAVQTPDLAAARAAVEGLGFGAEVKPGSRTGTGGERYEWETLTVTGHSLGAGMPIIKTWLTPNHPSAEAPRGCVLTRLVVHHPEADLLRRLYAAIGLDLTVEQAAEPALIAWIDGAKGAFSLPPR